MPPAEKQVKVSLWGNVKNYFSGFGRVWRLSREFHGTQLLVMLDCFAYFLMASTVTVYLRQDANLGSVAIGMLFAVFVSGIAVLNIVAGPIIEMLGYRRSIVIGSVCGLVGRTGVGLAPLLFGKGLMAQVVVFASLLVASVAEGLFFPVMTAGTKRYSNEETETAAFNYNYLMMQVGAIGAGLFTDVTRNKDGGNYQFFLAPAFMSVVTLALALLMFRREIVTAGTTASLGVFSAVKSAVRRFLDIGRGVVSESAFWRMILALLLIMGARMSFVYPMAVYPTYYLRVLGDDAKIGSLFILNPIIIFVGLILFTPALEKKSVFGRMLTGMIIAVMSGFLLALPPSWLAAAGLTIDRAYYLLILAQIVVYAVGEMVWSPVMQQFMLSFAPKGQEGAYAGFGMLPSMLSKIATGAISGFFLGYWCYEGIRTKIDAGTLTYAKTPEMMNLLLGFIGLTSPILFWIFRKRVMPPSKGSEAAAASSAA